MPLSALVAILVAGVGGAVIVDRATNARSRQIRLGAGALGGLAGALALSAPIDFCTFNSDAETKDLVLGLALMGLGGFVGARAAAAIISPQTRSDNDTNHSVYKSWIMPWLLLAPTLAVLVTFLYWPAIRTIRYSTQLARTTTPKRVDKCLTNFTELIGPSRPVAMLLLFGVGIAALAGANLLGRKGNQISPGWRSATSWIATLSILGGLAMMFNDDYRQVYIVTLIISGGTVIGGLAISLAVAFISYQPIRGASIYRTLLIWPYAISPPIAGILFSVMFDANTGIFDHWSDQLFGTGIPDYTRHGWLAQLVVIGASIWKTLGYNLLFYIAGLQTIPPDQIEASMIDGAGAFNRFRYVVVPALSPITFFLIVTNLTYSFFETYGTIDFLTTGGPSGATTVAMYEVIEVFNSGGDLGRGSAQSMLLFAGVVSLTIWQFRSTGRRVQYG